MAAVAGDASAFSLASFALRLYRDIKSCPSDFEMDAADEVACVFRLFREGSAIWGWNDGGGYTDSPVSICPDRNRKHHDILEGKVTPRY